jgi:MFS transporter, DHA1 family, tetracycline resistance protein
VSSNKMSVALWSLFLVLFIDGLGQGILYPILTKALVNIHSTALISYGSQNTRDILYSIVIGIFFLGWFFGGALLSDISDTIGRKKSLLICVAGSAIGYLLCAFSFYFHSIILLIIGRAIDGLTAGDQPIAQAAIIDLCPPEKKGQYIGLVLLALTSGIVVGPIVGGFLSDGTLMAGLSSVTPMYIGMWLSIIAFIGMAIFFTDTSFVRREAKFRVMRALEIFVEAFRHKEIRYLFIAYLLMQFGWTVYFLYMTVYLARHFAFNANHVALYIAAIGVGMSVGFSVLPRFVTKIKAQKWVVVFGYGLLGAGALISGLTHSEWVMWLIAIPGPACFAVAYTSLMPLFSAQVDESRQGWVMGLTGSVVALAAAIGPIFAGWLDVYSVTTPMIVAAIITFLGCLMMACFRRAN